MEAVWRTERQSHQIIAFSGIQSQVPLDKGKLKDFKAEIGTTVEKDISAKYEIALNVPSYHAEHGYVVPLKELED